MSKTQESVPGSCVNRANTESIFVQVDFYVARQVTGQKLVVLKQVGALIHPPQR